MTHHEPLTMEWNLTESYCNKATTIRYMYNVQLSFGNLLVFDIDKDRGVFQSAVDKLRLVPYRVSTGLPFTSFVCFVKIKGESKVDLPEVDARPCPFPAPPRLPPDSSSATYSPCFLANNDSNK